MDEYSRVLLEKWGPLCRMYHWHVCPFTDITFFNLDRQHSTVITYKLQSNNPSNVTKFLLLSESSFIDLFQYNL